MSVILDILPIFFHSFNYLTACFLTMFGFGLVIKLIRI